MVCVGPQRHKEKKLYFHASDYGRKIKTMQKQDTIFIINKKKVLVSFEMKSLPQSRTNN